MRNGYRSPTPERIEVKQAVLRDIQAACTPDAIIASSTSGFMPSELQADATRPEQIIVAHPYNPVYLLPIVECVPSASGASGDRKPSGSRFCDRLV
jgi:carnitine 3-dehydrogenase